MRPRTMRAGGASLELPSAVRRVLIAHARRTRPLECCGLLIGRGRLVLSALPTDNVERSTVRFRVDPRAHIDAERVLRQLAPPLGILGSYHSHPEGAAWPSTADVSESMYPDWVHVIVGLAPARPAVRAFTIRDGVVHPVPLVAPARDIR